MAKGIITDQNLDQFSNQLGEPWAIEQIAFLVDFFTESYSSGEAYRLLKKLEPLLSKSEIPQDSRQIYKKLLLRLKFVALPMLEDEEIKNLFQEDLLYPFKNDFDLKDRIMKLFRPNSISRSDLSRKNVLVQAMESNTQVIGSINLELNGKSVAPTLGNWIIVHKNSLPDKEAGTFEVISFLTENKFASKLDNPSKELLKQILFFYNWLRFKAIDMSKILQTTDTTPKSSVPTPAAIPVLKKVPPPTSGQDLMVLKKRIIPTNPAPIKTSPVQMPEVIKREVFATLPAHREPEQKPKATPALNTQVSNKVHYDYSKGNEQLELASLDQIKTMDDLKKISIGNLRQGELNVQTELIKSKINQMAAVNRTLPYFAVLAFEASPLFQAYLAEGIAAFAPGTKGSDLTKEEFEAMADLRKQIEGTT